jgi:hypothetical protein
VGNLWKILVGSVLQLALTAQAFACDTTLSAGSNIQTALNNAAFLDVCLNPGTYTLSTQLVIPANKTLEGLGSDRDTVKLVSSADRVVGMSNGTAIKGLRIQNATGVTPTYGILTYFNNNVIIWGLRIVGTDISIGINGSSDVHVWDTFMSMNGLNNGSADPNMWISDASNIDIQWGEALGRGNPPGGDGEIAAYNSTGVKIYGTYVTNSGASGIYLVNCDSCSVENATINNAGEWGLDIVSGTDNFVAKNNHVSNSHLGGSVFDGVNNLNGQYISNTFNSNNSGGYSAYCNGINYSHSTVNFTVTGSTGNPVLLCKPWP